MNINLTAIGWFFVPLLVLWLFCIIHCALNRRLENSFKITGLILIAFVPIIGCIVYWFLPRRQQTA